MVPGSFSHFILDRWTRPHGPWQLLSFILNRWTCPLIPGSFSLSFQSTWSLAVSLYHFSPLDTSTWSPAVSLFHLSPLDTSTWSPAVERSFRYITLIKIITRSSIIGRGPLLRIAIEGPELLAVNFDEFLEIFKQ